MATADIRVQSNWTVNSQTEELDGIVVTEPIAGVSCLPVLSHKSGMTPVVKVGGQPSAEEGTFNWPYDVAVDYQTGDIYVSEISNKRVQVFESNGTYLYKFGHQVNCPRSIAISENKVFVSQFNSNFVLVYDVNGNLITQFGSIGECQMHRPTGITINEINGDIYVCDQKNNIIRMFFKDLPSKSHFGQGILKAPFDIKLTDQFMYVLCCYEPFLYSFTYDFTQIHNTAIISISKHLKHSSSFCIDRSGHFIISNSCQNAVFIFNQQGELAHTITDSISGPFGVTLDSKGRILVVGSNHSLLIF